MTSVEAPKVSGRHPKAWLERPWVFHPFLVTLPTLLAFTQKNLAMAGPEAGVWMYLVFCGVAVVGMLLLQQILGNPRKAGVIVSLLLLGFVANKSMGDWSSTIWLGIFAAVVGAALMRTRMDIPTTFFNVAALIAVAKPVYDFVQANNAPHQPVVKADYLESGRVVPHPPPNPPDIYYIVLDGYGRSDVLRRLYAFDNKLPKELEKRGFYVADQAHSNYSQTALCFSATFNMDWVENLLDQPDKKSQWRRPLSQLVSDNRTVHGLRDAGYHIIEYPSEYSVTHLADPDESRSPFLYFTEYEYIFLSGTALGKGTKLLGYPQARVSQEIRRNTLSWVLTDLRKGDRTPGPAFVYAHLVAPHPPFLFKPDGSYRRSDLPATFNDGSHWKGLAKRSKEKYVPGYRDAVQYLDDMLIEAVDGILKNSEQPPIIIIQGDHGPASKLDWKSDKKTDLQERMSILLAYHFPDQDYSQLREDITPINSFRVVFNQYLGAEIPQVEDKVYFNVWSSPYRPIDVTEQLRKLDHPEEAIPTDEVEGDVAEPEEKLRKPKNPMFSVPRVKHE